jgi:hypothetical protein
MPVGIFGNFGPQLVRVQNLAQKPIIRKYSTRLVHGKRCKPDIQKSQYQFGKAWSTHLMIGKCRWNKKVQGSFPYYLIAVHEEADDECAHSQLIADTILLRYRGTSLTMSSETTRALPKTESWVAAWIDFCFRPTPSFFLTSEMKKENNLLERIKVAGRGALVASSQAS